MKSNRLATAEWAEPSDVAKEHKFETGDFWLGRSYEDDRVPIGYKDDRHICLVSGNRGGKGTSVIINNLCLYPGSVVVIDPKGENATVTASRRGKGSEYCDGMNQAVHVLDPFNVAQIDESYRSSFNPLDLLDPENEESIDEAERIADALVAANLESKEPYWDDQARQMIKALILHVLTSPRYQEQRNLVKVRELITSGYNDIYKELPEELKGISSAQSMMWKEISESDAFDGVLSGLGLPFHEMSTKSDKTFLSILSTANQNTTFIDSSGMKKCLSSSSFKLSDLKTDPNGVSLYLSLPQRYMTTHYRWLRMMVGLIVTEMEKVQRQPANGHRILMVLDEFAGLQRMKIIETAVAQIAGYGVTLFFVLQSLEQLKSTYKDNWETFLSNSGLKMFFSIEDHFTREYISKFVGDTEVLVESQTEGSATNKSTSGATGKDLSYDRFMYFFKRDKRYSSNDNQTTSTGTSYSSGRTTAPQKRPLISPDEMGKIFGRINDDEHQLYPGLALVMISSENPMALLRCLYYEDHLFSKTFEAHPDHAPTKARYEVTIPSPSKRLLDYVAPSAHYVRFETHLKQGQPVRSGDPFITLDLSGSWFSEDHRFELSFYALANSGVFTNIFDSNPPLPSKLTLDSPISGFVEKVEAANTYEPSGFKRQSHSIGDQYIEMTAIVSSKNPDLDQTVLRENERRLKELCQKNRKKADFALDLSYIKTAILAITGLIFLVISFLLGSILAFLLSLVIFGLLTAVSILDIRGWLRFSKRHEFPGGENRDTW